jgi:hypothetical protein
MARKRAQGVMHCLLQLFFDICKTATVPHTSFLEYLLTVIIMERKRHFSVLATPVIPAPDIHLSTPPVFCPLEA